VYRLWYNGSTMAMNIKNQETQKLAHRLADATGESLTAAITEAVRERLERVQSARDVGLAERLLRIGKDCAAHLPEPSKAVDHGDILYDDRGLPR
jgi:antitoxin VapB